VRFVDASRIFKGFYKTTEVAMKVIATLFLIVVFSRRHSPVLAGGISNELLLSSAWCTFKYNQTTGYSNTTRVKVQQERHLQHRRPCRGLLERQVRQAMPARAIPAARANGRL